MEVWKPTEFGEGDDEHSRDGEWKGCAPFWWSCAHCQRKFIRPLRLAPKFCSRKCNLDYIREGGWPERIESIDLGYAG